MDFFAVFQFFSENVELTAAQRRLELTGRSPCDRRVAFVRAWASLTQKNKT